VISLRKLDHVSMKTTNVEEASRRWSRDFGLVERSRDERRASLACNDEPYSLELTAGEAPGVKHVAYELRRECPLETAAAHFDATGTSYEEIEGGLRVEDPEGNGVLVMPYRRPEGDERWTSHARRVGNPVVGHPRKLGHVNFLTADVSEGVDFYMNVLGMRVTDWLGEGGVWLRVNSDHHVMALVEKGYAHLHHIAFDVVDIGQMRVALDHLGRRGRWLGWGPARHGVGGNIASYVRIVEEECFVELYCDMEQIDGDHEPRVWPDDRFSSNTWGPLPPRSYFRFDEAAVASERESLEMLGHPLPEEARK
jgi:catechol-2,3-dioxygenase